MRQLRLGREGGIDPFGEGHPVLRGAVEVPPRGLVLRLHDLRQGSHRGEVGLLEARERVLQVAAALALERVELSELAGEHDELRVQRG